MTPRLTPAQLRTLVDIAKASGCIGFKSGDFEIRFPSPSLPAVEQDLNAMRDLLQTPVSEEEAEMWHVGGSGRVDNSGKPVAAPALTGEDP